MHVAEQFTLAFNVALPEVSRPVHGVPMSANQVVSFITYLRVYVD